MAPQMGKREGKFNLYFIILYCENMILNLQKKNPMIPFSQFLLHFQQSIWKEITISISSWAENNKTYVSSPEKQLKLKNKPASTEILYRKSWHEVCMWQRGQPFSLLQNNLPRTNRALPELWCCLTTDSLLPLFPLSLKFILEQRIT